MVKKQSSDLALRKTQGVNGWTTKGTTEREINYTKQNIKPDRTKDNIFLKPKDDRTVSGDRLEAGYKD